MTTSSFAAGAYASMQGMGTSALLKKPASVGGLDGAGLPDFSSLVGKALESTAQSARQADIQTGNVAAGRSNVVDVVTAVAESEAAIETLVAVRDRVIAAYEEIMRMPV
ncbi:MULTISPECIES: flagellar hook-basal body complex protein FliE [unclassified Bosea (in: a-proteobacteria)]|uniref:flagellar hook-basal body complex protein FliE n=1 Tax=unclassified Bosea (in: a-proteobacteria) TaxID=2653178 RepID=UPI000F75C284|nr:MULTISPECIES: flagellar hook-basal body complex protein FliE [unclassified Bosea (in: a-proteobacteria)]AZO76599.1 flagellar hook-basal body protein FliE [Bosea sp. Tri-49]RXT21432.1 flagellar hook-basal body complex protein FliE [Bosea sp. Tri-39]RXT31771.1 flagellar hook-basal body complex protein FliE [Bosea sp. Tri-54]